MVIVNPITHEGKFPWVTVNRATSTLPQGGDLALFTTTNGNIELASIVGEVTTIIGGANATLLKVNPTATGADTDICAALDITTDAVGTIYVITGTAADALVAGILYGLSMATHLVIAPGDIELECAGSVTGAIEWTVVYRALEENAVLRAV